MKSRTARITAAAVLVGVIAGATFLAPGLSQSAGRVGRRGSGSSSDAKLPAKTLRGSPGRFLDGSETLFHTRQHSVVDDRRRAASVFDADTSASPGMVFGETAYDYQHNTSQGYQVAKNPGTDVVHFCWMYYEIDTQCDVCPYNRDAQYNSYTISTGTWNQGYGGTYLSLGDFARGGYTNLAVDRNNAAHVAFHQKPEPGTDTYSPWHAYLPAPGSDTGLIVTRMYVPEEDGEILWPRIDVQQNDPANGQTGPDVYHYIAHDGNADDRNLLAYWRYDGTVWTGPALIDSTNILGYVIAADPNSQKVAIVLHSDHPEDGLNGMRNIVYYESQTEGLGWIAGSELGPGSRQIVTGYDDPDGPEAWGHISCAYDHASVLHIIWDEQRYAEISSQAAIRHWSTAAGLIRPVAYGYWDNPKPEGFYDLTLSKMTVGIGDGSTVCTDGPGDESNRDYLYVLYSQFGGPTLKEQEDHSREGYMNSELYLTVSNNNGETWSLPVNLTNTKTPDCWITWWGGTDSACASEHWATIAKTVDDINIFYILDLDAGGMPQGEGVWTVNPVIYYRIPGGGVDDSLVCPSIAPRLVTFLTADPDCEYHAPPDGVNEEYLTIANIGNAPLAGDVSTLPGAPWLSVIDGGAFEILPGAADLTFTVRMDALGLSEGLYTGTVRLTHNDGAEPNPIDFPIDFFVVDGFYCPEDMVLKTAAYESGSLSLTVESDGRFASQNDLGGLWRAGDSAYGLFDATLLVAHGVQGVDTVVYHDFYSSADPGNRGFRPLGTLKVDTTAYGSGTGYAGARSVMTTADSAITIEINWYFPQDPVYADFVVARYRVWNNTASPIDEVVIGLWADLNVVCGKHLGTIQAGIGNHGASDAGLAGRNLIYAYGYDTLFHVPPDYLASSERYSGGVTYISGRDAYGDRFDVEPVEILGGTRDNRENQVEGGPTSHHLYHTIVGLHRDPPGTPGAENWEPYPYFAPDSSRDAYLFLMLDRGRTLAPNGAEPELYLVAWVTDTLTHPQYGPPPGKGVLAGGLLEVVDSAWSWAERHALCQCDCHADPNCDGVMDVLDVVHTVDDAFRQGGPILDPNAMCPVITTDLDCNGIINVFDVVHVVDVVFRNGDPATEYCKPCMP